MRIGIISVSNNPSLKQDDQNRALMYGLGCSLMKDNEQEGAVFVFENLLTLDCSYRDYAACTLLASLYWKLGYQEKSVNLLERVIHRSGRISHCTELAGYLFHLGREAEAREILEETLDDYNKSPNYIRSSNRGWAQQAESLLQVI